MLATDKARLTVHLDPNVDEKVRVLAVKHRKTLNISDIVEAALVHCLSNPHFIKKLTKKEEEIDY